MKEGEHGSDVGRPAANAESSMTPTPKVAGNGQDVQTEGARGGRRPWQLWVLAGAVIIGVVILALLVFWFLRSGDADPSPSATVRYLTSTPAATRTPTLTPSTTPTPTPTATPTLTPTPTPDVILAGVKALGELNTVQYNLETVVDKYARQPGRMVIWGIEVWRPHLHFLLVAGGRVKAGVDFRQLVRYEIVESRVTVYLPAPRITDYAIDMRTLKTYYIRTDFGLQEEFIIDTYQEAIVQAQESLRDAALSSDILDTAQTNATALVQSLILGLGFSEVEVKFLPPGEDEIPPLEDSPPPMPTLLPFQTATPE